MRNEGLTRGGYWDGFASGVGAVGVVLLGYLATNVGASRDMFEAFGGVLPWITRIVIHPLTTPGLAVIWGLSLIVLNAKRRGPAPRRTVALVLVAAAAVGSVLVSYCGLYAPIWRLDEAIVAD